MTIQLIHGDCLVEMANIPDGSVDVILTDPPYFKVKTDSWDNQWDGKESFLKWIDLCLVEFKRILKPNGSIYFFASPRMAAHVEVRISNKFNVLNSIRWEKSAGFHKKAKKECLRSFLSPHECIIFAENYNSDNIAKGEAGYLAKCDELRGFVFEPIRRYLADEFKLLGWNRDKLNLICGTASMAGRHYISRSQWCLPTKEHYIKLQAAARDEGLRREYEGLRREYEDLRREYEDLRRPFNLSSVDLSGDTWHFDTVGSYKGKHPCEKPIDMLSYMIDKSSKEGAVVFDPFMGSNSTGVAAKNLNRRFIGIELDAHYFEIAKNRIEGAQYKEVDAA